MDVEQGSSDGRFGGCRTADAPDSRTMPALAQRLVDVDTLACGREELADVVAAAQAVINAATAVQDRAIAHLAAIEPDWAEDATIVEVHHAPGHVALNAADIVAPALAASHALAQRRVDLAVRLAAGRVPRVDDTRALPEHTGLDGLHDAMREGRLDGYRAGVVAHREPPRRRPMSRRPSSRPSIRTSEWSPPPPSVAGAAASSPGSARTFCASAPSGSGLIAGCDGGSPSRVSTRGGAPSRARTPPGPGLPSTTSPAGSSPTACAPGSSRRGRRRSQTSSSRTPP